MDPLSATGLTAGIIELTNATVNAIRFVNSVKDPPKERQLLAREIESLQQYLVELQDKVGAAHNGSTRSSNMQRLLGPNTAAFNLIETTMVELVEKMQPARRDQRLAHNNIWPFKKEYVAELLTKTQRFKGIVFFALQGDLIDKRSTFPFLCIIALSFAVMQLHGLTKSEFDVRNMCEDIHALLEKSCATAQRHQHDQEVMKKHLHDHVQLTEEIKSSLVGVPGMYDDLQDISDKIDEIGLDQDGQSTFYRLILERKHLFLSHFSVLFIAISALYAKGKESPEGLSTRELRV
ncbi:MAG: hypothetical protein M1833_005192 [Piccolia ochrophora]|nr:MAG: hypothetical protein M1833_005192 [Piccolia ochrophora]